MRLPRQDTSVRLSAEPPAEAIGCDEALLERPGTLRLWMPTDPAVVVGRQKLVGLAQVRRRDAALFQFGVLLRDQSSLAKYLRVPDEPSRAALRASLAERTVGLQAIMPRSASEVAAAIADAMPFAT